MRALIAYASRHGQTKKVCEHIADVMRICGTGVHLHEIDSLPPDVRVNAFDLVVLASPVYFGRHAKKAVRFVISNREALAKTRTAFVSVSGAAHGDRPEAERAAAAFLAKTAWKPDRTELVAGGEPYTRYGFFTKWVMSMKNRQMSRTVDPTRDYEYTDWPALERFARELVGKAPEVRVPELALM